MVFDYAVVYVVTFAQTYLVHAKAALQFAPPCATGYIIYCKNKVAMLAKYVVA